MGDENPIRTLGDYSRPSHEGYRNTIELFEANVVPLRSDTIWLVQNGCSFHGLRSEDQHLKDFLKLMDALDLSGENRERTRLLKIFYDRIDHTLKQTVDYAARGRLRKISAEKAWATIEELARYEDEGWNDPVTVGEGSLDCENLDIE
nr:MAK10-like protein [Tanacetum cinerariifolium]